MCAIAWQQALPPVQVEADSASKQLGGTAGLQRLADTIGTQTVENATFGSVLIR